MSVLQRLRSAAAHRVARWRQTIQRRVRAAMIVILPASCEQMLGVAERAAQRFFQLLDARSSDASKAAARRLLGFARPLPPFAKESFRPERRALLRPEAIVAVSFRD